MKQKKKKVRTTLEYWNIEMLGEKKKSLPKLPYLHYCCLRYVQYLHYYLSVYVKKKNSDFSE